MSVIINNKLYVKGASEIVLKNCTHWESSKNDFKVEPLSSENATMINDVIEKMASKSLRTLVLGYR
jgi:magnesium-transporting ATPase (P-type)